MQKFLHDIGIPLRDGAYSSLRVLGSAHMPYSVQAV